MTESLQGKYTKEALENPIGTSDFWYDLTDGGYIDPRKILLDGSRIFELENAIAIIMSFKHEIEDDNIIFDL